MQLTTVQRQMVEEQTRNCCVISIPGSGKTSVITAKLSAILNRGGSATAVTFTSESGKELRERMSRMGLSQAQMDRLETGTFHGITWKRLKELQPECQKRRIAKPGECRTMMGRAIELGMGGGISESVINLVEMWRGSPDPLEQNMYAMEEYGFSDEDAVEAVARTINFYMKLMKEAKLIDFTEIMWRGLELLRGWRGAKVYAEWQQAPERMMGVPIFSGEHILVDEMQDIDAVQLEFMLLHHLDHGLAVDGVGDDDQSIYAFRKGLGIEGMRTFQRETDALMLTMDTNFRCKEEILRWAGKVIEQNADRAPKELKAHRGKGGSVRFLAVTNEEAGTELDRVANMIAEDLVSDTKGTVAVLCRGNSGLREMEAVLQDHEIPYAMIGGKTMWEEDPMCLWARALSEWGRKGLGDGLRSLLYWCGCNETDLGKIGQAMRGQMLWGVDMKKLDLSPRGKQVTTALASTWQSMSMRDLSVDVEIAGALLESAECVAECGSWSNVNRHDEGLVKAMMKAAAEALGGMKGTLQERGRWASSGDRKKQEEGARVKLVTMHSSKGLEFESVYIIGATQKSMPGKSEGPAIEEERRVLYVAMTRAKNKLTITYSTKRKGEPCPFLMGLNPLVLVMDADTVVGATLDMERYRNQALTG